MSEAETTPCLENAKHFKMCNAIVSAGVLHDHYDSNRLTLLYFALMGATMSRPPAADDAANTYPFTGDAAARQRTRDRVVAWVYSLQLSAEEGGGFASTHTMGKAGQGHITMTQCALLVLVLLGDDLRRVDKDGVRRHLRSLQGEDGCFRCIEEAEADMRFVYSACVVAAILGVQDAVDAPAAARYIASCQRYDGAFGKNPHCEGHGGITFLALAALALMGRLRGDDGAGVAGEGTGGCPVDLRKAAKWTVARVQPGGFNGRYNKRTDTCYAYWVGSTLALLRDYEGVAEEAGRGEVSVDTRRVFDFVVRCQSATGGIARDESSPVDILHTALPLMGLSNLQALPGSPPLNVYWGIPQAAVDAYRASCVC
eukprot:Rhum_TRINITY_DN23713_c0_g1::Rhum_TRINITY_DN23713_c0_g1_i1::g.178613::m.178613/K11713/PGTB1; geranylgeranyl transferase type-1 subunit beta